MDYTTFMEMLENPLLLAVITVLAIWELTLKGFALWRAGRNNQSGWFVPMLLLNTVGVLPLLYLIFFQKKSE